MQAREKAVRQYAELGKTVARNPELGVLVQRLEAIYDARAEEEREPDDSPPLSPQVERFLLDMDERFSNN